MSYIPHSHEDTQAMLEVLELQADALFQEIPAHLKSNDWSGVPDAIDELTLLQLAKKRAQRNPLLSFLGAGAYEHYIPPAVWALCGRGEFYSAYTPYQAEASQGTLKSLYEYQTMMARLTALEVANAGLYDGATALAEALLMALRLQKGKDTILLPQALHPHYRQVIQSLVPAVLHFVPFHKETGQLDQASFTDGLSDRVAAVVLPLPNFFGIVENPHQLTDLAHEKGALVIALVNPLALAILTPPGQWGTKGADIAVGEGQPLGLPLSAGGPYIGFMATKMPYVRHMPGRIVGRTKDMEGKDGFVLTLQAREQHIRRGKATSNICTNQGLMALANTIYLAYMGDQGLFEVASRCHENSNLLLEKLSGIKGVQSVFKAAFFHEMVLKLEKPAQSILEVMRKEGLIGGYALEETFPELGYALLCCTTETKTPEDIECYAAALEKALSG